jgi:hypothetical protein
MSCEKEFDPVSARIDEVRNLKQLLFRCLPDLNMRLKGFRQCWPGEQLNHESLKLSNLIEEIKCAIE